MFPLSGRYTVKHRLEAHPCLLPIEVKEKKSLIHIHQHQHLSLGNSTSSSTEGTIQSGCAKGAPLNEALQ